MANITLLGLESGMTEQLTSVLRAQQHYVRVADSIEGMPCVPDLDIVFSSGDAPDYGDIVRELLWKRPGVPVVVVNRLPENRRWLDALELGAADYCGAPFEPLLMRWLVDAVLRRRDLALAA